MLTNYKLQSMNSVVFSPPDSHQDVYFWVPLDNQWKDDAEPFNTTQHAFIATIRDRESNNTIQVPAWDRRNWKQVVDVDEAIGILDDHISLAMGLPNTL